jgi:integrase
MLRRYIADQADKVSHSTLDLRMCALSQWHTLAKLYDPTTDADVKKVLRGSRRANPRVKKQAMALPVEDLEAIVAALSELKTMKAKRDSALLQIGFFGGFRRSELVGLTMDCLRWKNEGLEITLRQSKTDQEGRGITKAIPYAAADGAGPCCPATALRIWLDAAGITEGAVFRGVVKGGGVQAAALNDGSVTKILRECAEIIGLDYVPELSSHSLRRGMATSAYRAGVPFRDIKRQGGWRHDGTVHGYIEEASMFEENAAAGLLNRK